MLFDRQETLSRVLESTTAFVRFRYKAFLKLHFIIRNGVPLHFTIRNTVPYNKPLTNRACSGSTGEYWRSVVAVRTSLRSVRTTTTSGQYSPVRPSRSVSKRLIYIVKKINCQMVRDEKCLVSFPFNCSSHIYNGCHFVLFPCRAPPCSSEERPTR